MWVRERVVNYNIPPEILCVLMEKGKEDTGLTGRR